MRCRGIALACTLLLPMAPSAGFGQESGESVYTPLTRGIRTASVHIIGGAGPLSQIGGFSPTTAKAAAELEFRKAGIQVVSLDDRTEDDALLLVMVVCLDTLPVCAVEAVLSRLSNFGPERTRIAGQIWSSGPTVLTDSEWLAGAQRLRHWITEQAIVTANLIRSANDR